MTPKKCILPISNRIGADIYVYIDTYILNIYTYIFHDLWSFSTSTLYEKTNTK